MLHMTDLQNHSNTLETKPVTLTMHTHAGSTFHNPVILTFDLRVNVCRGPVMYRVWCW